MFLLVLAIFVSLSQGQNWFVQRTYGTASCTGSPFVESAADGGSSPCSAAQPCQLATGGARRFFAVQCTGTSPSLSILSGYTVQVYQQDGCQGGVGSISRSLPYQNCTAISGGGSVRFACDGTGVTEMRFTDQSCSVFSFNQTFASGTPGQCNVRTLITCTSFGNIVKGTLGTMLLLVVVLVFFQ